MISRALIDEIIYRNDIEQVIGSYVTLKRAGSNWNGLCPFHNEKTPSFTVFPATKSFYCFGCGAGGDVISFVMREENLDYRSALEHLADRAGLTLPEDDTPTQKETVSRKRMYEMNLAAAKFFRNCLFDPQFGAEALRYLTEERKLDMLTIKRFGIGFSPNDWGLLTNHMHSLGFTDEELMVGFLCGKSQKTGRTYDYFRNRVIFPIIDTTGNVIAFGGRVMDDSKPKYLNTSDTPAFKKSRHLFALNYAKHRAAEQMLLCEGYMDVIALHAAGFDTAVATLGTAITSEQARLFAKYTKRVVICYDADNAGQTAASKAMRLLGEVGVDVRVLKLTGAKDPDEYIKTFGADAFRRVLEESKTGFEYRLGKLLEQYNLSSAEDVIKASEAVCAMIAEHHSEIQRDIYIRKASEVLGVPKTSMKTDVERLYKKNLRAFRMKESQQAQDSIKHYGDRINEKAATNLRANAAEEIVLGLMLIYDDFRRQAASGQVLSAEDFSTDFGRRVFEVLCELENSEEGYSRSLLGQFFDSAEMGRIQSMELERRQLERNDQSVFDNCVGQIKQAKQNASCPQGFDDLKAKQEEMKRAKKSKNT
ncbi:MAG: DNA primase [Clostridia bacterium]|nr:DNA primase [Clostridia bacterium]